MEIKVYKLFFLIIFIPTFCLAYEGGDKPYSVFGNDTEVLDIDHNEYWQGWQMWMILPDREIAKPISCITGYTYKIILGK